MAVIATKNQSTLKLYLNKGVDENSKQITGTKSYAFVDADATDEDIFAVAKAIGNLQKHDVFNIIRLDNKALSE